mgnify:CR=1 FL=1
MSYEFLAPATVDLLKWKAKVHGPKPGLCFLHFTPEWATRGFKWCGDKYFQITRSLAIPYSRSAIIPNDDWVDFNLSNIADAGAVKGCRLYPEAESRVHEILVGFKPGNYLINLGIGTGATYFWALPDSTMTPDLTDANRRYLAFKPEDSPEDDPTIKLWAIKDLDAWILRCYVLDGVGFEKVVPTFKVIKHQLKEIAPVENYTEIKHFQELSGAW